MGSQASSRAQCHPTPAPFDGQVVLPHTCKHAVQLLRAHAQHVERDAVELVKAAPQSRLRKAPKDLARPPMIHLVAAVEHHHVFAQSIAQVFCGLGLACACRASGGTAERHAESLREGDVASVRQRGDDEALFDSQVLVRVLKVDVADGDDGGVGVLFVGCVGLFVCCLGAIDRRGFYFRARGA